MAYGKCAHGRAFLQSVGHKPFLMPPEFCPHCGAEVPPNARACPECGSDEQTGWSDRATADRLGLPDEDFDYAEFVKEEFGGQNKIRPRGVAPFWWIVAMITLAILLALLFRFA